MWHQVFWAEFLAYFVVKLMIYLLNIAFAVLIIAPDDHAAEAVKYALLGTVAANLAIEAHELAQDQLDYFSSAWN